MTDIDLLIGLGNPGSSYQNTRHNAGFWALDAIAANYGGQFVVSKKFFGELCQVQVKGRRVNLLKPHTFMNQSGQAALAYMHYFKIQTRQLLVIHDELDLCVGRIKFKRGGSNGGHNGLKDIETRLNSTDYYRLRLGIGRPHDQPFLQSVIDYVLSSPSADDMYKINTAISKILDHLPIILSGDFARAQRILHSQDG